MAIEQITDHAEQAKERLPDQFSGATNLLALLDDIGARYQDIETQFFKLLDERHLSVAVGVQLDGLGQILDLERELGQNDTDYRAALVGRSGELSKSGEIENLIFPFLTLTGAALVFSSDYYPAGVLLVAHNDADAESAAIDTNIIENMNKVKAGGVDLTLLFAEETTFLELSDESETDINNNGPTSADNGLGDEALTEGGGLARVIL